jgi:O-antigen ligase/tetratricopeptide (TPR) repeat protein
MAVLALSLYLVFFGGSWYGLYQTSLRTASVGLALAALGVWALVAWRLPTWRVRSVLLPIVGLVVATIAASTTTSRFPRQSLEYLAYAVVLAALYLLFVRVMASPFLRVRMGLLATAFCLVLCVAYLGRVLLNWLEWWQLVGGLAVPPLRPAFQSLTFGDPASVATLVLLLFAAAAARPLTSGRQLLGVALLGVLVALVVLTTGSRSVWLALVIVGIALVAVLLSSGETRRRTVATARHLLAKRPVQLTIAAAAVVAIAGGMALGPGILARVGAGGDELRATFVTSALRMFAEAPLLGTGPGTWVIQRVRYTYDAEPDYYIPHAHNLYAQTLAELGLAGVMAGVVLLVTLAWLIRNAVRDGDPARRRMGWAAFLGVVFLGTQQVFDFHANMPAILFAAALPIAWLDASAATAPGMQRWAWGGRLGRAPVAVAFATVAISGSGLLLSERTAAIEDRAVRLANAGDWAAAYEPARSAVELDPAWPPYQLTLGLAAAYAGDHVAAADAFRRAATTDDLPEAWLNLAAEEALLGRTSASRAALVEAMRLGLQRPAIAMAIGQLAAQLGESQIRDTAFVAALVKLPTLAGDVWWQTDAARAARFMSLLDAAAEATGPASAWQILMAAGEFDRARSTLPAAPPTAGPLPGDVIDAWSGDRNAFARVLDVCRDAPSNTTAIDWCARLSARVGDLPAAQAYREQSFLLLGDPFGPFEIRVADGPLTGGATEVGVAHLYGAFTYRRYTPANLLAPSLIHLEAR